MFAWGCGVRVTETLSVLIWGLEGCIWQNSLHFMLKTGILWYSSFTTATMIFFLRQTGRAYGNKHGSQKKRGTWPHQSSNLTTSLCDIQICCSSPLSSSSLLIKQRWGSWDCCPVGLTLATHSWNLKQQTSQHPSLHLGMIKVWQHGHYSHEKLDTPSLSLHSNTRS